MNQHQVHVYVDTAIDLHGRRVPHALLAAEVHESQLSTAFDASPFHPQGSSGRQKNFSGEHGADWSPVRTQWVMYAIDDKVSGDDATEPECKRTKSVLDKPRES